jgi:imidazole glycerol-phosphate synthase subunit HisH
MITVIASAIANLGSVQSALRRVGVAAAVTSDAAAIRNARALILPGVGAYGEGMASLRRHGLIEPIREAAAAGTPILGVCLGMQLLADTSEEFGRHDGLGLICGRVVRLQPRPGERVPNIGWCDLTPTRPSTLYAEVQPRTPFYFVHSYQLRCSEPADITATIMFGGAPVTVGIERGNIFGAQFHPEKSQDAGLAVLAAFANFAERTRRLVA